jgi:hypothetical protein
MTSLARALWAERLKMKRTLALRLAFIIPLAGVGLQFMVFCQRGEFYLRETENAWIRFGEQMFVFWALLMLPLFVTLETALLGGLEHKDNHWKHLYALPLPRWAMYAAKQVAGMALIGLSIVALVGFSVLAGFVLRLLKPGLGFEEAIPWAMLLKYTAVTFLASWLIISIHTWVGLRWHSFVVAVAVGIVMTISGVVFVNADWGSFYPWALPGLIANGFNKGMPVPLPELLFGSVGGIVAAFIGGWEVTRRDVL